jgi:Ser/Thr protein kinase RdoA (MazF antagonist)
MRVDSHKPTPKYTRFPCQPEWLEEFAQAYKLSLDSIEQISSGNENSSFVFATTGRKFVLRVYRHNRKPVSMIEREVNLAAYLFDAGLPVPKIVRNRHNQQITTLNFDSQDWHAILMPFMPGKSPVRYDRVLLADIARLHAQSHILGIEYADRYTTRSANPLRRLIRPYLPRGYSHYDWFGPNVLTRRSKVTAIIDFDDAHYGLTVRCLIRTLELLYEANGSWRDVQFYLRQYQNVRRLTWLEKSICVMYLTVRHHHLWTTRLVIASLMGKHPVAQQPATQTELADA